MGENGKLTPFRKNEKKAQASGPFDHGGGGEHLGCYEEVVVGIKETEVTNLGSEEVKVTYPGSKEVEVKD
ncbi:unnamed protein product [Prunus armeniaca]